MSINYEKKKNKDIVDSTSAQSTVIGTRFIFSPERTEKLEKHKMAIQDIAHQAMKEHDL